MVATSAICPHGHKIACMTESAPWILVALWGMQPSWSHVQSFFFPSGGFLQTQWSPRSANQCRGRYGMNLTKWQRWQCWQHWQHVWNMGIRQYRREVPGFLGFVALRQRLNSSAQARVRTHAVMFYYWQIPCTWRHVIFFQFSKQKLVFVEDQVFRSNDVGFVWSPWAVHAPAQCKPKNQHCCFQQNARHTNA